MNPLSDVEAALLYTVQMWGASAYPLRKASGHWYVGPWREWKGFPTSHKTKKAAIAQFDGWIELALERWRETKAPEQILTAVGVK